MSKIKLPNVSYKAKYMTYLYLEKYRKKFAFTDIEDEEAWKLVYPPKE